METKTILNTKLQLANAAINENWDFIDEQIGKEEISLNEHMHNWGLNLLKSNYETIKNTGLTQSDKANLRDVGASILELSIMQRDDFITKFATQLYLSMIEDNHSYVRARCAFALEKYQINQNELNETELLQKKQCKTHFRKNLFNTLQEFITDEDIKTIAQKYLDSYYKRFGK